MQQVVISETEAGAYLFVAAFGVLGAILGVATLALLLRPGRRASAIAAALPALVCCIPAVALYREFVAVAVGADAIRFEYPTPRPARSVRRAEVCGLALVRHGARYRLSGWRSSWTLEVELCNGEALASTHAWRSRPAWEAARAIAAATAREPVFRARDGRASDRPVSEAEWASPAPPRW